MNNISLILFDFVYWICLCMHATRLKLRLVNNVTEYHKLFMEEDECRLTVIQYQLQKQQKN